MLDKVFNLADPQPMPFTGFVNNFCAYLKYMQYLPTKMMKFFREATQNFSNFIVEYISTKMKEHDVNSDDVIGAYILECDQKKENVNFDRELMLFNSFLISDN